MPYVKQDSYQILAHPNFNSSCQAGIRAPFSGIYRCTDCGYEIAASTEAMLPMAHDDPRHDREEWNCSGQIKWQPVAFAIQKKPQ